MAPYNDVARNPNREDLRIARPAGRFKAIWIAQIAERRAREAAERRGNKQPVRAAA